MKIGKGYAGVGGVVVLHSCVAGASAPRPPCPLSRLKSASQGGSSAILRTGLEPTDRLTSADKLVREGQQKE